MENRRARRSRRHTKRRPSAAKRGMVTAIAVILCVILIGGALLATGSLRGRQRTPDMSDVSQENMSANTAQSVQMVSGPEAPPETSTGALPESTITVEESEERGRTPETLLAHMTLEEKVAQLFFVTPEVITGYELVTRCGDVMRTALTKYPVGGLVFLAQNLEDTDQTRDMLAGMQEHATDTQGVPVFLGLDEEGGRVLRIAANPAFHAPHTPPMMELAKGGEDAVYNAADAIGGYLSGLGFNLDFAPVADVWTNPENEVIGDRAFSSDPEEVARMAAKYAQALEENGILAVYKHFPGHGDTLEDTHEDYAYADKTLDELKETELIPFADGIDKKVPMIMVAHISLPKITGGDVPATLSDIIVTDLLRKDMGYRGIIITDALDMGAISEHYTSGEACILAIEAGCDMLLMKTDFTEAYEAVLNAVRTGRLTEERIDESVLRILSLKFLLDRT